MSNKLLLIINININFINKLLFENKSAIAAMVLNYIHAGIALSGGKN